MENPRPRPQSPLSLRSRTLNKEKVRLWLWRCRKFPQCNKQLGAMISKRGPHWTAGDPGNGAHNSKNARVLILRETSHSFRHYHQGGLGLGKGGSPARRDAGPTPLCVQQAEVTDSASAPDSRGRPRAASEWVRADTSIPQQGHWPCRETRPRGPQRTEPATRRLRPPPRGSGWRRPAAAARTPRPGPAGTSCPSPQTPLPG